MSLTHGDPSGWAAQPHMAIPQARLRWREGEGGPLLSHTLHHTPRAICTCQMWLLRVLLAPLPPRRCSRRAAPTSATTTCARCCPRAARPSRASSRRATWRASRCVADARSTHCSATHARAAVYARQTHARCMPALALHTPACTPASTQCPHADSVARASSACLRWLFGARRGWCCGCATTRSPTCASTRRARCCRWASSSPTTGSSPRRPPSSRGCRCFFPSLQALL